MDLPEGRETTMNGLMFKNTSEEACWLSMAAAALSTGANGGHAVDRADYVVEQARLRRGKEYEDAVEDEAHARFADG
jgi:hypothetical protein